MLILAMITGGSVAAVLTVMLVGCALDRGGFRPHIDWGRYHTEASPAPTEPLRVVSTQPGRRITPEIETGEDAS
jgi:hypothetical protein